ncbi:MAG: hypothetical protein FJY86_02275 [Candidatus Diapherotrites archaeon]|uniref:Uncharacterized protein n=1 Tax=Candidatus Iainarchaeum sp. TaxID=3101447 RepID=A0A8T4C7H7_9ARCH|nr:hypothetical protein [Candidatus Diapherotrites archaeon]
MVQVENKRLVPMIGITTPTRGPVPSGRTGFRQHLQSKGWGGTPQGQSTIELLVIVAVALVILSVLVGFTSDQVIALQKQQAVKTAQLAVEKMVSSANELYTQGSGASRFIEIVWPNGIDSNATYISGRSMVVTVFDTQVSGTANQPFSGSLPVNAGIQNIRLRAMDGFVLIGDASIVADPTTVLVTMDRNSTAVATITISNLLSEDAVVYPTKSWSYSDVNATLTAAARVYANDSHDFNVTLSTSANAVGVYTGYVSFRAVFSSKVETIIVPIQVNVSVGNGSQLVAFPSSLSLSTFGIDTNSTTIQLCNVGLTDIKTVTISPSSGAPGSWISSFSTMDTLSSQTCQSVDVNVSVPTDTIANYYATLHVSDYTGANNLTIPVTISVRGMDSVFRWDWTPAIRSTQSIYDFSLANVGRKKISLTQLKVYNWTQCDNEQSLWNSFSANGVSRFLGSLADGNTANISDVNIPSLTSYTDNALSFSDNISDDNETFIAVVDFSDGTQYTSATFGNGCAADTTPPAMVSDLQLVPGPEPESMVMSFTFPGDDGNSGRIYDINMRIAQTTIANQSDFDSATVLNYSGTSPFPSGGTAYSQILYDYDVGELWTVSVQAIDENGNRASISNAPVSKPWNEFRFTGNDFNFSNFAPNSGIYGESDVNTFLVHTITNSGSGQLIFSVVDDASPNDGWIVSVDLNDTHATWATIWNHSNPNSYWLDAADFNAAVFFPLSSGIDFLDGTQFSTQHFYNGLQNIRQQPLTFRVHRTLNVSDFNLRFDIHIGMDDEVYVWP